MHGKVEQVRDILLPSIKDFKDVGSASNSKLISSNGKSNNFSQSKDQNIMELSA